MKKFLTMFLILAMVLSLSFTALAVDATYENETWTPNGGNTQDVTVEVTDVTSADEVRYVVVAWESMEFTYNKGSEGTWNTTTHSYDNVVGADWEDDSATITVTSHSNVEVTASATFDGSAISTNFGVTATITGNGSIATADAEQYRTDADNDGKLDAPTTTFTVTVTGAPDENYAEDANVVGTITISIT